MQPLFPLLLIGVIVLGTLSFAVEGYSAVKVQSLSARVSVRLLVGGRMYLSYFTC